MACRSAVEGSRGLCADCWAGMHFIERPFCERLGTPFAQDLGVGLLSPEALANPPVYGRARAVARFDDGPARSLIHHLKYGDRPDYARVLGTWMARVGGELLADADVIVPIPLHPRRLWQRRYNQAALLSQSIGRSGDKRVDFGTLSRVKATRSQVGMSRSERGRQRPGCLSYRGGWSRDLWSARRACGRRAHDGSDRKRGVTGSAAGWCSKRRRPRVCEGRDNRLIVLISLR